FLCQCGSFAKPTLKEERADLCFQCRDMRTDRCLRDLQPTGGSTETATTCDSLKDLELTQCDRKHIGYAIRQCQSYRQIDLLPAPGILRHWLWQLAIASQL